MFRRVTWLMTASTFYCMTLFSERLFREMADMMVVGGYQAAGYNTIIVDDCWPAMERDKVSILVSSS
jgi:hypothetical protein